MYKIFVFVLGLCFVASTLNGQNQSQSVTFFVAGECEMCADRVKEIASKEKGVLEVAYDLKSQQMTVTFNEKDFDLNHLQTEIANAGHDTEAVKAPDEVYEKLPLCCLYRADDEDQSDIDAVKDDSKYVVVNGMSDSNVISFFVAGECEMCADRVKEIASKEKGVLEVAYDLKSQQMTVTFDEEDFDLNHLQTEIANAGHDTEAVKAPDEVYENLPLCCLYRDEPEQEITGQNIDVNGEVHSFYVAAACGMCVDRIAQVANSVRGVKEATYDLSLQEMTVVVDPDKFKIDRLHKRIAYAGHNTSLRDAPDYIYDALPLCCKYREEDKAKSNLTPEQLADRESMPLFGYVFELDEDGNEVPVIGANVYWESTTTGTSTDVYGIFILPRDDQSKKVVVSYIGFGSDTIAGPFIGDLKIVLGGGIELETVNVVHRQKSTEISFLNTMKVESIGEKELLKAACCNLSESFETNPSIDVAFTDAVTGTRQIQMLGLAGPYVQIMRENLPDIRGLSALYGFTYTPGPWIEGIQLNKGTGSVVNGFESMTGQINVELRKPEESERMYLNLYANEGGRLEGNLNLAHSLSDNVHTGLLLHGSSQQVIHDRNDDGFLDMPNRTNLILTNRWKFIMGDYRMQVGVKVTDIEQTAGQTDYGRIEDPSPGLNWGATQDTRRVEGWIKFGKIFPDKPYKSIGFQLSAVNHDQNSTFGLRRYDANQKSAYANLIYQTIIGNTNHGLKFGASAQYDLFDESVSSLYFRRKEFVPGVYGEYTYTNADKFSAVVGMRVDHHNVDGVFVTPRFHMRYAPSELTVLRASLGRGRRTATIFAENVGVLASSRRFVIDNNDNGFPYGLNPEVVWNGGLNFTQGLIIGGRSAVLGLDLYRTHFSQQVVVDFDQNPQEVWFYSLDGESYSNSIQVQLDYEVATRFDVRLAYRFNDVRTDYQSGFLQKPLIARNRAFINLAYETVDRWKFDFTLNWQGQKRIPDLSSNPSEFQRPEFSPSFFLANAQVSKQIGPQFEMYLGGENLFNFRQDNPIISSENPFGDYFDSSLVWGPIFGRNIYAGIRYRIAR